MNLEVMAMKFINANSRVERAQVGIDRPRECEESSRVLFMILHVHFVP